MGLKMKTVCELDQCVGCMACIERCPRNAIAIRDSLSAYNAIIDEEKCISCDICHAVCQNLNPISTVAPTLWKQGYAADEMVREKSSSGGFAAAIEKAFAEAGGVVFSCTFQDGRFMFDLAETATQCDKFTGSKYVKSDMTGTYRRIKKALQSGKKVLFVGLPCQVAAVKLGLREKELDRLFTIDLICHGTPSPSILHAFLEQYGYTLNDLKEINFRCKSRFQEENSGQAIVHHGVCDRYMIAFLNGLTYTENCYQCQFAKFERVSDLTLGDSWGSELDVEEQRKGLSLVLCQTDKGRELLNQAQLKLFEVDIRKAIDSNQQLKHPSEKPKGRKAFFEALRTNRNFNILVTKQYPKLSFRQDVKHILYMLRILRGGVTNIQILYGVNIKKLEGWNDESSGIDVCI